MELGRFRVGLRVSDATKAAHFYRGLGFAEVGTVPGDDGRAVMTILQREGVLLLVDALVGMPFAPTEREHQVQNGPRGLGVALGLGVDDLAATYAYCRAQGCTITAWSRSGSASSNARRSAASPAPARWTSAGSVRRRTAPNRRRQTPSPSATGSPWVSSPRPARRSRNSAALSSQQHDPSPLRHPSRHRIRPNQSLKSRPIPLPQHQRGSSLVRHVS